MSEIFENVIGRLIEEKARTHRDRVFLFFEDQKITYEQLDLVSNQFAHGFRDFGIQKGDKIAIMMQNHPNYLYTWFGSAKLGAIEVPINTAYKGDSLKHIINNSDSKLLVIDAPLAERLLIIKEDLPKLEQIICRGNIDEQIRKTLPIPISSMDGFFNFPTNRLDVDIKSIDPAGIVYTSGTTGLSKGVVLCHNIFVHVVKVMIPLRQMTSQDILYTCLPLFHLNAQVLTVMNALVADAQVALSNRFSASTFWDEIRKYGATQFNYLGGMMTILLKQEPRENDADNPARIALGAACPPDVMKQLEERFGIVCLEGFGMSETGIVIHWTVDDRKAGSCGKVLQDLFEVKLVDDEDMEVAMGKVGEIVVRPKKPYTMMSEYYRMPEKTLESFRNLWFHTGDYGKQDEEGYYYFVDRKKDALRRRGENISSFEVEKVINSHPKVLESAVFAVPSELGEDEVKANVVLRRGEILPPEDLIKYCNERMAYFAIPRYLEFVSELPKTPTNRVEKYLLRQAGITQNTWDREKAGVKITR
jgi:crotonobetaine/carnitine-CoA ligase